MKRYVLDTFALMAYAEGERGGAAVAGLFNKALDGGAELFMCVVNWGEIYYITLREEGKGKAGLLEKTFARYPITLVDADLELTLAAARLKAFHKISYADAFAAGLAQLKRAELVTGDREFAALKNEIRILWI